MFNQHAKWLKVSRDIPWRHPLPSLNYLLSSHVWRQDHNGFSHQDPGFIDHVVNKKAEVIRVYLPPDANCLLSVADHCLCSRHYVNVIVAGKQPTLDFLSMEEAIVHCTQGAGIWEWASNDEGAEPDVVLGCCGDVPTLETLAATAILREHLPDLRVRVVNVVDLMRLQPESEHPHGLSDSDFDALFTTSQADRLRVSRLPWLVHRLTYRRANHHNLHVRGYKEEGTTTTPFDMVMLNDLDRYHLVMDVIDRVPGLAERAGTSPRADERPAAARAGLDAGARRGPPGRERLDLAVLSGRDPRRQRRVDEPEAVSVVGEDESVSIGRFAGGAHDGRPGCGAHIASFTADRGSPTRWSSTTRCAARSSSSKPGPAPQRARLRGIEEATASRIRTCRMSRSSTRRFTRRSRRRRPRMRSRGAGARSGGYGATGSTASRCSGRPSACR